MDVFGLYPTPQEEVKLLRAELEETRQRLSGVTLERNNLEWKIKSVTRAAILAALEPHVINPITDEYKLVGLDDAVDAIMALIQNNAGGEQ